MAAWFPSLPCRPSLTWTHQNSKANSTGQWVSSTHDPRLCLLQSLVCRFNALKRPPLRRFGVRPLPKRQMILKLKEIHQYTHQLASSDSEEDTPPQREEPPSVSCHQTGKFKEPRAPAAAPPVKPRHGADAGQLSASQGSNTSSAACSDESER